jgi:hypothetical protein
MIVGCGVGMLLLPSFAAACQKTAMQKRERESIKALFKRKQYFQ